MRLSSHLPLAIVVAAASVAVGRPVDDYVYTARSDAGLSARDLRVLNLFMREYLPLPGRSDPDLYLFARDDSGVADLPQREYFEPELVARGALDQPKRESYKTWEEWDSAMRAWNARMGKLAHATQKAVDKHGTSAQPQRQDYRTAEEWDSAMRTWNAKNRKLGNAVQKNVNQAVTSHNKEQAKKAGSSSKNGALKKKVGFVGKLLGKKGKRGVVEMWDLY
ncbi:uncharacterized protein C8Q71DRAFT_863770 [Rhodofomes roseus]|uniref:Uncharacterized protein n=1 Tax=Rhodofomes roseus TaxID=34475 RepID=A0ABQ8JXC8_9APHY|nr:uncharacterized protein C8Q71DRAFT_863770 [Rhodofomes roseus]KAH9828706.1 hypothetical protein C8Q71DRAFT_863770 [Rhodofomes roseus]